MSLSLFIRKGVIRRELTTPYNPTSNGVAKRVNKTLYDKVRCIFYITSLSQSSYFWVKCFICAKFFPKQASLILFYDVFGHRNQLYKILG